MKNKKIIITLTILFVFIISILVLLFVKFKTPTNLPQTDNPTYSEVNYLQQAEDNGWDTKIVSYTVDENVPIPNNFSYVQGDKNSGIIVEETSSHTQYLFIPHNSTASFDISKYFKNVEAFEPESDTISSIEKYGGFYVQLNYNLSLSDLETISTESYNTYAQQIYNNYNNSSIINSHILSNYEIIQIEHYLATNNVSVSKEAIGAQAITIEKFSSLAITSSDFTSGITAKNELVRYASNTSHIRLSNQDTTNITDYVYIVNDVPIPSGFKYSIDNGIVSIQDESNKNLVYIWVPLMSDDIPNVKSNLKAMYETYVDKNGDKFNFDENSELYNMFNNTSEELSPDFEKSIEQYGGFYISEAELGYDSNGNYYNKARGMVESSVTLTINGGNYYRKSKDMTLTYNKIEDIANSVSGNHNSVVSHLMYGLEYDATLLWISSTNNFYIDSKENNLNTILLENSTYVGKYSNSNLSLTASAIESSKYFNGIWGLGGNLSELTQENYSSGNYVIRGGSFATTGEDAPIASRKISDTVNSNSIGFRTCLYIKPDLPKTDTQSETFENTYIDDTSIKINSIDFIVCNEIPLWINSWDAVNIYERPSSQSKKLSTLTFAKEVKLVAKAKEKANNILWLKVKLSDSSFGFIDASKLTNTKTIINNVDFIKNGNVARYYYNGLTIYKSPSSSSTVFSVKDYVGTVNVVGKSISQTWAIIEIDNSYYYVYAKNLSTSKNTEDFGNYTFILGSKQARYVIEKKGATLYLSNGESSSLKYGTEVQILGLSTDESYAKVSVNNTVGYVQYSLLSTIAPKDVDSNDNTTSFIFDSSILLPGIKLDTSYTGTKITDLTEKEKGYILHMLCHEQGADVNGCILVAQVLRDTLLYNKEYKHYGSKERADVTSVLYNSFSSHYCSLPSACSYGTQNVNSITLKNAETAYNYVFLEGGSAVQHKLLAYATTNINFSGWPARPYRVLRYGNGYWWCWSY